MNNPGRRQAPGVRLLLMTRPQRGRTSSQMASLGKPLLLEECTRGKAFNNQLNKIEGKRCAPDDLTNIPPGIYTTTHFPKKLFMTFETIGIKIASRIIKELT